jgi:hypothetical protein
MIAGLVFERAPRRVYWEVTRACDLACRHCRAEATLQDFHEPIRIKPGNAIVTFMPRSTLRSAEGRPSNCFRVITCAM